MNSQRIAFRRKQLGMTQEELAERVGTSQRQISKYETGKQDPTGDVIIALAFALDTTADWLLGLTNIADRPLRGQGDLSQDEIELLEMYRNKPSDKRKMVLDVARVL